MRLGNLTVGGRLDRYVGAMFAMSFATAILLVLAGVGLQRSDL